MKPTKIDVFLSCSFSEEDKTVNDFFRAICNALDINIINVSQGYSAIPPEKAKNYITASKALIAIATHRTRIDENKFAMPSAVREEISMAFGLDKPILLLTEEGVVLDGFMNNYGTHLTFNRNNLAAPSFLEIAIGSIHSLIMEITAPADLSLDQDFNDCYAEYKYYLLDLVEDKGTFCWVSSVTQKLIFLRPFNRALKNIYAAANSIKIPTDAELMEWSYNIDSGSRDFKIIVDVEKNEPDCFQAALTFEPHPMENDFIEYSSVVRSKYRNPIYREDLISEMPIIVEGNNYLCHDGNIPAMKAKKAVFKFRFPRKYGLKSQDIQPIVASYTSNMYHYSVESEIKRSRITKESIAGNISIRFEVDSPLVGHIYGIAWNPPSRIK